MSPGGADAAKQLERLLTLEDEAQYGFTDLTTQKLQQAVRRAKALLAHAENVMRR